jgi:hypothetical protein
VCTIIHNSAKSKDGSIVEQKNRELFEQKNTIPSGLESRNFSLWLVATKKSVQLLSDGLTGSVPKHL